MIGAFTERKKNYKLQRDSMIYRPLYVDDMPIACSEMKYIDELKGQLNSQFEMKDLGPAHKI